MTAAGFPVFAISPAVALGAPLLGAGVDWLKIIIWVVVIGAWAINQLMALKNKPGAAKPAAPRPQPNAGNAQRGLLDEVERFLKDARKNVEQAQQRQAAKSSPPPARAKPPKLPQSKRNKDQERKKAPDRSKQKAAEPQRRRLEPERSLDDVERGGSVAQHVRQHLDTSRFDQRAEQLSKLQQKIEQDIGAHVKSVFDHQIGTLAESSAAAAESTAAPSAARQIADLLRDPQGVRNAVLLQEILRPPVERW